MTEVSHDPKIFKIYKVGRVNYFWTKNKIKCDKSSPQMGSLGWPSHLRLLLACQLSRSVVLANLHWSMRLGAQVGGKLLICILFGTTVNGTCGKAGKYSLYTTMFILTWIMGSVKHLKHFLLTNMFVFGL